MGAAMLSACADDGAEAARASGAEPDLPAANGQPERSAPMLAGGAPAQPDPARDDIADENRVIGMEDIRQGSDPACKITFAYAGYTPETLIWSREPCADVSATFLGRAELTRHNDWQKLTQYDRERFAELPGGTVLYVSGSFAASVYPIDYNHLTYEVAVSD